MERRALQRPIEGDTPDYETVVQPRPLAAPHTPAAAPTEDTREPSVPPLRARRRRGSRSALESGSALAGAGFVAVAGLGSSRRRRRSGSFGDGGGGIRSAFKWMAVLVVVAVIAVAVAAGIQVSRAVPAPVSTRTVASQVPVPGSAKAMPWPSQGQAAVDVQGVGSLGSYGASTPIPIASLAKMMTALVILHDHPLSPGQSGPSITITPSDVAQYQAELAQRDSVAAVYDGEVLTEQKALEELLIPSADNVAVILATWDAGSLSSFVGRMNSMAKSLGLSATHYADASGLSSHTVSDAKDQVSLAEVAMQNPTIASIVAMPQLNVPGGGLVYNYDYDLGKDGIVGVKTGSDGPAGGCFMFDAREKVAGATHSVFGVILGQQSSGSPLQKALDEALPLINAVPGQFVHSQVLRPGQVVGEVSTAWGPKVALKATAGANFLAQPGQHVLVSFHPYPLSRVEPAGTSAGRLVLKLGSQVRSIPVRTAAPLAGPTLRWRLLRA